MKLIAKWKESKTKLQLLVEWNYLQNEKEIRKERKKESRNQIYLKTSPVTVPKSDENQYFSKNVATPGATNFTSSN